jgi:predicted nucleic acid-binding protein
VKVVVDTNVVAYYLLGTEPFVEEARNFWRSASDPIAPAFWEAEIANVVWMAVRSKVLPAEDAFGRLRLAGTLGIRSVRTRTLWHGALTRAVASGVAAYDTLFIELAERERRPFATFDRALMRAFPEIARSPANLSS